MSDHQESYGFDAVRMVRGGSRGFSVLLVGGVVQPWVGTASPALGYWWLALVAVAAFVWAARTAVPAGSEPSGWVNGPAAAVASYLLVLPLVVSAAGVLPTQQVVFTAGTALLVGTLVAVVRLRGGAGRRIATTTPTGEGTTP